MGVVQRLGLMPTPHACERGFYLIITSMDDGCVVRYYLAFAKKSGFHRRKIPMVRPDSKKDFLSVKFVTDLSICVRLRYGMFWA